MFHQRYTLRIQLRFILSDMVIPQVGKLVYRRFSIQGFRIKIYNTIFHEAVHLFIMFFRVLTSFSCSVFVGFSKFSTIFVVK